VAVGLPDWIFIFLFLAAYFKTKAAGAAG